MNDTMRKFGAPGTCVKEYSKWVLLLRPQQVTLGSLVLVCREPASAFSGISAGAFAELATITSQLEQSLARNFDYDKINYLMLMMVDPDVHFHVIPRYAESREFGGQSFHDYGWPGPPALGEVNPTDEQMNKKVLDQLKSSWIDA